MKTLVAFYSRTGNTKKIAEEISKNLDAEIDEIIDEKNRKGMVGFVTAGRDAMKKSLTKIKYKKNPANYSLVIIGTPNWANAMCPAIRTYLMENKNKIKKFAFFSASGGDDGGRVASSMQELCKNKGKILAIEGKSIKDNSYKSKVKEFCKHL